MGTNSQTVSARGRWLISMALGFGALFCFGWMQTLLPSFDLETFQTERGFQHPVLALEFAASHAEVEEILGQSPDREAHRLDLQAVQRVDWIFPIFYGGFLLAVAWALRAAQQRLALTLALGGAFLAVLSDYAENAVLANLLAREEMVVSGSAGAFLALALAARLKFALLGAYGLLVSGSLSAGQFGGLGRFAAIAGRAAFVALALAVALPARAVEPASAILALFWLALLALVVREAAQSQRHGEPRRLDA